MGSLLMFAHSHGNVKPLEVADESDGLGDGPLGLLELSHNATSCCALLEQTSFLEHITKYTDKSEGNLLSTKLSTSFTSDAFCFYYLRLAVDQF